MIPNYDRSASVENHPRKSWKRRENNFFFKTVDNNDNFIHRERDSERGLRNVRIKNTKIYAGLQGFPQESGISVPLPPIKIKFYLVLGAAKLILLK